MQENAVIHDSICDLLYEMNELAVLFKSRFEYIGTGRHRHTFKSKTSKYVFKIPHCIEGMAANESESVIRGNRYARCKLFFYGNIPVIIMETVKPISWSVVDSIMKKNESYKWIHKIDCRQVGTNRAGKIVAYDFSDF